MKNKSKFKRDIREKGARPGADPEAKNKNPLAIAE